MDKAKALEALKELKQEANYIQDGYALTSWKNKATNLIVRIYGKDSLPINQIAQIKYFSTETLQGNKKQADSLTDGLIKEIERFDIPKTNDKEENKGVLINITQTQQQKAQISLNLLIESIQEELKGSQLKELQTIIEEKETEPNEKKNKIVETLKKFGGDVASNIVANILTNPSLFV